MLFFKYIDNSLYLKLPFGYVYILQSMHFIYHHIFEIGGNNELGGKVMNDLNQIDEKPFHRTQQSLGWQLGLPFSSLSQVYLNNTHMIYQRSSFFICGISKIRQPLSSPCMVRRNTLWLKVSNRTKNIHTVNPTRIYTTVPSRVSSLISSEK